MQILVNMLSNAIKYTKKGAILIIIDWQPTWMFKNKPEGVIKFTVSDSGCGIPKNKRKDIFKFLDFSRLKIDANEEANINSFTTKLAGTGLGISQKIAMQLKSKIEFTSIVGTGSKFHFKLETSTVRKSPIFSQFSSSYSERKKEQKNKSSISDMNLHRTIVRVDSKLLEVSPHTKRRSLSIDDGNANYEKSSWHKRGAFNLVDIDQVSNVEVGDANENIKEKLDRENLFLNKYSRIRQRRDSNDSSKSLKVADEEAEPHKIPYFVGRASHESSGANTSG